MADVADAVVWYDRNLDCVVCEMSRPFCAETLLVAVTAPPTVRVEVSVPVVPVMAPKEAALELAITPRELVPVTDMVLPNTTAPVVVYEPRTTKSCTHIVPALD